MEYKLKRVFFISILIHIAINYFLISAFKINYQKVENFLFYVILIPLTAYIVSLIFYKLDKKYSTYYTNILKTFLISYSLTMLIGHLLLYVLYLLDTYFKIKLNPYLYLITVIIISFFIFKKLYFLIGKQINIEQIIKKEDKIIVKENKINIKENNKSSGTYFIIAIIIAILNLVITEIIKNSKECMYYFSEFGEIDRFFGSSELFSICSIISKTEIIFYIIAGIFAILGLIIFAKNNFKSNKLN